ncbi:MAG: hypothetical protein ACT4O9_03695 [Blastocatellia bacterium]
MFVRLLAVLGLSISLLCCSDDQHTNAAKMLGNESLNQKIEPDDRKMTESPVTAFGVYSNIDGNGVHESGHAVDLWSHEGDLIGVFVGSDGTRLVGDPPTGILRDVLYNADTGVISFRSRLGDVDYEFNGNLSEKKLSGRLYNMGGRLQSQRCDEAVGIVLIRSQKQTDEMQEYPSLDEWKERMNEILRFRD